MLKKKLQEDELRLIRFVIRSFPDCVYEDSGKIVFTSEWLVGSFAGRGFEGSTLMESWTKLKDYFNINMNRNSLVGDWLAYYDWPNYFHVLKRLKKLD